MNSHSTAKVVQSALLFVFQSRNKTPSPIDTLRRLISNVQLQKLLEIRITKKKENYLLQPRFLKKKKKKTSAKELKDWRGRQIFHVMALLPNDVEHDKTKPLMA
jgi:hypothetical protein